MVTEIRNRIIMELEGEFSAEQLNAIDLAVAKALRGCKVEQEETLPAIYHSGFPVEVREFFARKKMKGCSVGTLKRYKELLTDFCLWLDKDIKNVTDVDILTYLAMRGNRGVSNHTLDGIRRILSSFYTFLHDTGKIAVNPVKAIDPIKYKAKVREPLNDIELEKVRNACQTLREKALFEVLYSTGCRVSEIVGIDYADINIQTRSVIVTGKGDQERFVFFNAKSLLAIENYMATRTDDNPALSVSERAPHERIKKNAIENVIRAIGERSEIGRGIFPHLLRHTFATDMLEHGAKIDEVSTLLGHKKLETTRIYAKTSTASIAAAHRKFVA